MPFRDLSRLDRVLLASLLPLFLGVLVLHVREIVRTGLAQPEIYVLPGQRDAYPVVGGFRIEGVGPQTALRVGDRLLRVGDSDLRGRGYVGFDAVALEEAGTALATLVVFERDGETQRAILHAVPRAFPWTRLPAMLAMVVTCTLILLRSRGSPSARLLFVAFTSFAVLQATFQGGPRWQTYASATIWNAFGPFVVFWMLRWATNFPDEVAPEERPSAGWAWGGALAYVAIRVSYLSGVPIPPEWVGRVAFAANSAFLVGTLLLLGWNYRKATPVGRRRAKWVMTGGALGASGMAISQLIPLLAPGDPRFAAIFSLSILPALAAPIGVWVAVARFNLFDVDRIVSATAAYSLLLAGAVGAALVLVSSLSAPLAQLLGVQPVVAGAALALGLAGLALPASGRIRSRVDELFFPERVALRQGIDRLVEDLGDCRSPSEVFELVGDRVGSLLRVRSSSIFVRTHPTHPEGESSQRERFVPFGRMTIGRTTIDSEPEPEAEYELESPLVQALVSRARATVVRERGVGRWRSAGDLAPETLAGLDVSLLLPLLGGEPDSRRLSAFVALGPKRSGDVYTETDLQRLDLVAECASAELVRIRDARILEDERAQSAELERLRGEAEDANRAKSKFLAAASHDLRQPLQALSLFVEGLHRDVDGDETRAEVTRLQDVTREMTAMMNALLDISRLDVGAVEPEFAEVPLAPLFERLKSELAPAVPPGVRLEIADAPQVTRSDASLLARILQQLLANALRFTRGGRVSLSVRPDPDRSDASEGPDGEFLLLEVADTGPGIAPDKQHEVFQEFVRLDSDASGVGLGLSIADKLCALLGHSIDLHSAPGQGTRVSLRVPFVQTPSTAAPQAPTGAVELTGRLVAVVDDDLDILVGMRRMLEAWGCEPLVAASGAELLEALAQRKRAPDLVLSDWRLAGDERGPEVILAVSAQVGREVPAALVTGESEPERLRALRALGYPVLTKPVSPARLRALVQGLLAR